MMDEIAMPSPEVVLPRLGALVVESVLVGDQSFLIRKPSASDDAGLSNYVPFWADLWPGARMLAKAIAQEAWAAGTEALELGCGLGLPGIVALSRGLKVTFSDHDPCALRFAADNARLNGFENVATLQLDWRRPPTDCRFSVILGAELVYESTHAEWLTKCIKQLLTPDGIAWLTDLERVSAKPFHAALASEGLRYTSAVMRAGEPGGRRYKGTLYRIVHALLP